MPRIPKRNALKLLKDARAHMPGLGFFNVQAAEMSIWMDSTEDKLRRIFGSAAKSGINLKLAVRKGGDQGARNALDKVISEIEEDWPDDEPTKAETGPSKVNDDRTARVFVVHGRDEAAKEAVARFLEKCDLRAVILHEQPNNGRTIIEKFEDYATEYAVVLLTPDDEGKACDSDELKLRARQNVVFEMGFFFGRLGRERVFVLKKGDLEIPSDVTGIVYEVLDEHGGWKQKLVTELKTAGFDIDANQVFGPEA